MMIWRGLSPRLIAALFQRRSRADAVAAGTPSSEDDNASRLRREHPGQEGESRPVTVKALGHH